MKVFLTERLTPGILSRYAHLVGAADVCWTTRASEGLLALPILDDARWRVGTSHLIYATEARLADWAHALAESQTVDGRPLASIERAWLTYGLEMRLWHPAMATAFVAQSTMEAGKRPRDLAIDVVAEDPYLRDAFTHARGIRAEAGSVRVHRIPDAVPHLRSVRERLAASRWLRSVALGVQQGVTRRGSRPPVPPRGPREGKAAVFFALNQRYMDLFQPVLSELESRGWSVPLLCYNPLTRPANAISFADATLGARASHDGLPNRPSWLISDALLKESAVSRRWIDVALSASWMAARTQLRRHVRALTWLRPDVVISFGPETMSLALQGAAGSLGIPSLLLAHGFQGPAQSSWVFAATASAVTGAACVEVNRLDRYGIPRQGLVATGHPPYDGMLVRSSHTGGRRTILSTLGVPLDRPYIVLALARWGTQLIDQAIHWKSMTMLAEALPDDAVLVYKLHPSHEERAFCDAVLSARLPKTAFRVVGESESTTPELLGACHVAVMQTASMSLADALIMDRPAIAIDHDEFPCTTASVTHHVGLNHPAWAIKDGCWRVRNSAELRKALVALTRDESARRALLKFRRAFIEEFLVAPDGHATQRVADLIEHLGAGKSPDSFVPTIGKSLVSS